IRTFQDVARIGLRVFADFVKAAIQAQAAMGGGQGFSGFIGGAIARVFGNSPTATPSPVNVSDLPTFSVAHAGWSDVGRSPPPMMRRAALPAWANAPRYHFGSDEVPVIAQRGERIFSRVDNGAIVSA